MFNVQARNTNKKAVTADFNHFIFGKNKKEEE